MNTANSPIVTVVVGEIVEANAVRRGMLPVVATAARASIVPRGSVGDVRMRPATLADLPFIDRLQKAHSRELGFLPRMALEGKVRLGQVLIAEAEAEGVEELGVEKVSQSGRSGLRLNSSTSNFSTPSAPIAYLIAADRYFKRDEVGYITQINVVPEYRRSLVAGALLQAQFDRSAYGCRLYCCWCAQDLKANEFWEAMGFAPIAFRTGSRTKGKGGGPRIHIFWQKRIRAGDEGVGVGATPWWYPSQTGGGELREDRLVFPIPPGVSWRDVLPVVLPEGHDGPAHEVSVLHGAAHEVSGLDGAAHEVSVLDGPAHEVSGSVSGGVNDDRNPLTSCAAPSVLDAPRINPIETSLTSCAAPCLPDAPSIDPIETSLTSCAAPCLPDAPRIDPIEPRTLVSGSDPVSDIAPAPKRRGKKKVMVKRIEQRPRGPLVPGGMWFEEDTVAVEVMVEEWVEQAAPRAKSKPPTPKIDPRLTAMARELRDRWSERAELIVDPTPTATATAKHDVRRMLAEGQGEARAAIESSPKRPALPLAA